MISRRVVLGAGGVALLAAAVGYRQVFPVFDGPVLDAVQAHQMAVAGAVSLIDIRRPDEWALTGTGEGAQPLDMRRDDFTDALGAMVRGNRAAPIALICARGVRSARMANLLVAAGFTRVLDVPEGMLGSSAGPGWIARGLPLIPG